EISDGFRLNAVSLVAIFIEQLGVDGRQTRIADQLPAGLVAIAAIDWIGEVSFHGDGEQRLEELLAVEIGKLGLAAFQFFQRSFSLFWREPIKILAKLFPRPLIDRENTRAEKLPRRERKLIAVLGFAFAERSAAIELRARTPGARKL